MEPRNYEAGAAGAPPAAPAAPSVGYPTESDPQTATPATKPGAHWYYKIGESLRNVITSAGLTPDDSDLTLFQKAIIKIIGQSNNVVQLEDVTFNTGVADGDAVYWDSGNTRYDKALADGTAKQNMVGFADVTNSLVEAFGRSALFSGLTPGSKYYLSNSTAGAIVTSAPSNKVIVGLAKLATTLFVDIDPDSAVANATETVAGVSEVATQAETDAGALDNVFVPPLKLRFGFAILLASNGYITFPSWMGGSIIQWGKLNGSLTPTAESFPIAFPSACYSMATSPTSFAEDGRYAVSSVSSIGASSFIPRLHLNGDSNAAGQLNTGEMRWIAIGY